MQKFLATYLDPETKTEKTSELVGPDRNSIEDDLRSKGCEVVSMQWLSDALPIENLEMQDSPTAAAPKAEPNHDGSWLGLISFLGLLLAVMDFFTFQFLSIAGDFLIALAAGLLLIVASIKSLAK